MPIIQQLVDYSEVFRNLRREPIILNDLPDTTLNDRHAIQNLARTYYTTDMLSALPQCDCGETRGEHAVGVLCEYCNTPVHNAIEEDIEPLIWFRKPEGVSKLINPAVWGMLNAVFKQSGEQIPQWMVDPTYRFRRQPPEVFAQVSDRFPRGYNNFVTNFDEIIQFLFSLKLFDPKKDVRRHDLQLLLKQSQNAVFSDYLPMINKSLVIIEKTKFGIYMDPELKRVLDVVFMIAGIDNNSHDYSQRQKENMVVKTISKLHAFYERFEGRVMAEKTGVFRKHIFASRTHFNFRAVITSLTETHQYDEIHIPWGIGMTAFREHLINKLLRRGFLVMDAIALLYQAVERYDPLLHELFNELIAESPWDGLVALIQRNPSMLVGSAACVRISKIKTDPEDKSISISILIVSQMNADFDGDQVNGSIAIDNMLADKWMAIAPHVNVFTLDDDPGQPSGNIGLPKPVIATMNNWMTRPENDPDPAKVTLMQQYFH